MSASLFFFFFNDTATTEIYTLSLHDALPIWPRRSARPFDQRESRRRCTIVTSCQRPSLNADSRSTPTSSKPWRACRRRRSEEHTSELQSRSDLVCRLLLEEKKKKQDMIDQ